MVNYLVSIPIDIEVVIIMSVYLLAYGSETGAGIFALGQGLLTDIFSGGIWGFHAILYIIIFLFVKGISRPFDLLSAFGQIALVFVSVLVKEFLSVPLLQLFSLNMNFSSYDVLMFILSALSSGLIAPLIFYLLNSFGRVFHRVKMGF
jgi:rod shape-determining protein MreD